MAEKYIISRYIAGGTSGSVFLATDKNDKKVAIKSIRFILNKKDQYKRPYREICILKHINSRFCLSILDLYCEFEGDQLCEVCLVVPYIKHDLKTIIHEFNLKFHQIIQISYQLLMGLSYLRDCGIIHRDLKPSNIGLKNSLDLKILDFGLARDKHNDLTKYVVTRYYRPLEVFCTCQYTTSVDIWSAGCIFAELFTSKILFKGKSQTDQSACILKVMGWPDEDMLNSFEPNVILGLKQFQDMAASSNQLEKKMKTKIDNFVVRDYGGDVESSNDAFTLLARMLELNPDKRITPADAIKSQLFVRHGSLISSYVESGTAREYSHVDYPANANDEFWKDLLINEIDHFNSLDT